MREWGNEGRREHPKLDIDIAPQSWNEGWDTVIAFQSAMREWGNEGRREHPKLDIDIALQSWNEGL